MDKRKLEKDSMEIQSKNYIEIEKKFRLSEEQYLQVCSLLKNLKAEFLGENFEENKLFTNEYLSKDRAVLRLRRTDSKAFLTYKKRIQNQLEVKSQIEYETAISDAEATEKILENSGFKLNLVYEKRRKTWRLRNAEVVLDELPFGFFMEIEGTFTSIIEVEALLETQNYQVEHETYPNLTLKHGKKEDNVIQARF
jgi:adenylate cyclase class 2